MTNPVSQKRELRLRGPTPPKVTVLAKDRTESEPLAVPSPDASVLRAGEEAGNGATKAATGLVSPSQLRLPVVCVLNGPTRAGAGRDPGPRTALQPPAVQGLSTSPQLDFTTRELACRTKISADTQS